MYVHTFINLLINLQVFYLPAFTVQYFLMKLSTVDL